jgi:hypothetical protein
MRGVASILSRRQLFLLAAATARLGASEPPDFWNRKPADEWDTSDIYRLANHSPWANPVQSWPQPHSRGGIGAASIGGSTWGGSPEWGPMGVVTWESARPIRDAFKSRLPELFDDFYVIGVDGIPRAARNLDSLRQFTVLRGKGKQHWSVVATVAQELVRNSEICAFGFHRDAAPIDPDTTEVVFETQFGRWLVQTKFRPKDMLYHGELAL